MDCVHCGDTGVIRVVSVVPVGDYWGHTPPYDDPCNFCPPGEVLIAMTNVIGEANDL